MLRHNPFQLPKAVAEYIEDIDLEWRWINYAQQKDRIDIVLSGKKLVPDELENIQTEIINFIEKLQQTGIELDPKFKQVVYNKELKTYTNFRFYHGNYAIYRNSDWGNYFFQTYSIYYVEDKPLDRSNRTHSPIGTITDIYLHAPPEHRLQLVAVVSEVIKRG